jgi:hypothetical protein
MAAELDTASKDAIKKDWDKAVAYSITDEDIERAKLLLDVDLPHSSR